ncbi:MAG: undecaprenyl-diphosphate phosphatase [Ruminococcus sp.]
MSVLQAILLGIVQGITEFLPVSSFGHLAAIENAMGITRNTAVLFEVLLHIGTMVAVFLHSMRIFAGSERSFWA